MKSLQAGVLAIDVVERAAPPTVQLLWRGKSMERHPHAILAPFFAEALALAAARAATLEMNFQATSLVNSSTVSAIIELIQNAHARAVALVIHYDPAQRWQQASFDALRAFDRGDGLLEIEPI